MVSVRQIGYLGGWAVALGIGAAFGAGTAHADSTEADSPAESPADSPASNAADKTSDAPRATPLSKIGDRIDRAVAQASATLTKPLTKPVVVTRSVVVTKPKPKPSPEQFESEQVQRLKNAFEPKVAATTVTTDRIDRAAAEVTAEPDRNPFRENDPGPYGIPDEVVRAQEAVYKPLPEPVRPYVREGLEASYRVSQMVPYVNAPIPIVKIIRVLPGLLQGDERAKDSAQIIVNGLLLTTPPVSFLYYGYDLVADLANVEDQAQANKVEFYATAWDTLDPNFVLHNKGEDGID
jgi:hypothetical protein